MTATSGGTKNNITSAVTSTEGGTGNTASASITVDVPSLTLAKSHSGNFAQGQTGATYTLTVSNVGAAATTGTVTVTDTLPSGLTATAMTGPGWACTVATLTCTRSDPLASGASYPPITLTVNVAPTASGSVTNSATVSGGGGGTAMATDPTIIGPPAPIPTLGTWAFILLALVLATTAVRAMRSRRTF